MELHELPLDREVWKLLSGDPLKEKIQKLLRGFRPMESIVEFVEQQQLISKVTHGGISTCWYCSFADETFPGPSHEGGCPLYLGPIAEHKMHKRGMNGTFGGIDYYCIACGGWFRQGGMAGHGDGSWDAEVRCPNEDSMGEKTEIGYLNEIARRKTKDSDE